MELGWALHALRLSGASIDGASRLIAVARVPIFAFGSLAMLGGPASAETRAGTAITNIAVVTGEEAGTIRSNPATLVVAERLDVALARGDDARIEVTPGGVAVPLRLTNRGNGQEAFDVVALPSDASARVRLIAIDRDGDGRFDAATDPVLAGGRTPALDPDAVLPLLLLVDPAAATVTATALTAIARAATGSGPAGTMFALRGDAGADAVTGATDARVELSVPIGAVAAAAAPVLVKSQSVRAPDGASTPVGGAIVTYRLEARFAAATAGARIDDPIPPGTRYVRGSLTLDDAPLSDAADADPGQADDAAVAVVLGDIAAAATRTIQFQVTLQ